MWHYCPFCQESTNDCYKFPQWGISYQTDDHFFRIRTPSIISATQPVTKGIFVRRKIEKHNRFCCRELRETPRHILGELNNFSSFQSRGSHNMGHPPSRTGQPSRKPASGKTSHSNKMMEPGQGWRPSWVGAHSTIPANIFESKNLNGSTTYTTTL